MQPGSPAHRSGAPGAAGPLLELAGPAKVTPSAATTISLFEPVVAAALGVVVVGERLGAFAWSGIGLVLAGLFILTVRRRPTA